MNVKHASSCAYQALTHAGQSLALARVLPSGDGLLLPLLLAIGCRA